MSRIAVLGAGAWGTALALSLVRQQRHDVTLWAHTSLHAAEMERTRGNTRYLPGFTLPIDLRITSSLQDAVAFADIVLSVTPSQHMSTVIQQIDPAMHSDAIFVSASKGIEDHTFHAMHDVFSVNAPGRGLYAALGGPSFAREVAAALPTAVVLATESGDVARRLQTDFSSQSLRVYTNDDVTGVELGGALKNVIALAAGVVAGLELGSNASAALITRGMAEITRLAVACGARQETMAGLAGYGDLVLTCTGTLSRNRTVGVELGRGRTLPEIIGDLNGKVAEGVRCTSAALGLAERQGVEMPITREIHAILHEHRSPLDAMHALMTRPGRDE